MRIAFFVNDIATEKPSFTTTRLAKAAADAGHDVFHIGAEDFAFSGERIIARAHRGPSNSGSLEAFIEDRTEEEIVVDDLDVLMLRNNPSEEASERPWAQLTGLIYGDLAVERGVLVLSHPGGLYKALNKLYLLAFPEEVRPRSVITRDDDEIKRFLDELGGRAVIKPLQGFGGRNVFFTNPEEDENLSQMIESVKRDGYVVVQEYLPAADEGDIRMILVNGKPLQVEGRHALFRRVPADTEKRSNMAAGGTAEAAELDEALTRIAEIVRPTLVRDGMFFVGIDVVGTKMIELNVFSPGGLGSPHSLTGVDFAPEVISAIERKLEERAERPGLSNVQLATL
jgi:glutathione synthase